MFFLKGSSLGQYDSPQESPITSVPQESEEPSQTGDNLEGDEGVSHEEVCALFHLE